MDGYEALLANDLKYNDLCALSNHESKVNDAIEATAVHCADLEGALSPIETYIENAVVSESCTYVVKGTALSIWAQYLRKTLGHGQRLEALLSAWELMMDDSFSLATVKERKGSASDLRSELTGACSKDLPFPPTILLILGKWTQLGKADAAIKQSRTVEDASLPLDAIPVSRLEDASSRWR